MSLSTLQRRLGLTYEAHLIALETSDCAGKVYFLDPPNLYEVIIQMNMRQDDWKISVMIEIRLVSDGKNCFPFAISTKTATPCRSIEAAS